jgi:hypothetical protein
MKHELRKISDIKPYLQNPRAIDDVVDRLEAPLRESRRGQLIIVTIDRATVLSFVDG